MDGWFRLVSIQFIVFISIGGLVRWMGMVWQADAVQIVIRLLPLNEMHPVDFVAVEAIPNVGSRQCCC